MFGRFNQQAVRFLSRLPTSLNSLKDPSQLGAKSNRFATKYKAKPAPKAPGVNNKKNQPTSTPRRFNADAPPRNAHSSQLKPRESKEEQIRKARLEIRKQQETNQKLNTTKSAKTNNHKRHKPKQAEKEKVKISVPTFMTVANLASILGIPLNNLLKNLATMGFENMRHNYILDKENVSLIADEYGFEINMNDDTGLDLFPAPELAPEKLKPRAPIVTIMGHVDHGKTTILDYLRKSSIVDKEFGGITQHIGAFSVLTPISKKKITFLDTPGHAAFLKMRERGANVTDIVILVVAADDSVMPQTIEAIKHAKKAGVPMIVAINKCDKPGVKVDKVLSDLALQDIDIEDYGGDTQTVQVSGKTGLNMDKLEEAVITLSDMLEFKGEVMGVPSEGWVIESEVVKGMGPIATVLVTRSTLKVGDIVVAGTTYCKVRGMKDENGKAIKSAGPSTPVQLWGWKTLPHSGDQIIQAKSELIAKKVCDNRINRHKDMAAFKDIKSINTKRQKEIEAVEKQQRINELKLQGFTDEDLKAEFEEEETIETCKYFIRSDVFGSAEAIKESIQDLGDDEVTCTVVSHAAGPPTDSDINMAAALGAKILCFNLSIPKAALNKADKEGVEIKEYNIIYRLIEDVTEDLVSKLKPIIEIKVLAEADIRGVFSITNKQKRNTKIAGCKVLSGTLKRSSTVRVLRKGEVIFQGSLSSLKQVKDDVNEIKKGNECGLSFDGWEKFEEGDKLEAFEEISHKRFLKS